MSFDGTSFDGCKSAQEMEGVSHSVSSRLRHPKTSIEISLVAMSHHQHQHHQHENENGNDLFDEYFTDSDAVNVMAEHLQDPDDVLPLHVQDKEDAPLVGRCVFCCVWAVDRCVFVVCDMCVCGQVCVCCV